MDKLLKDGLKYPMAYSLSKIFCVRPSTIEQSNNPLLGNWLVIPDFNGKIELPINQFIGSLFMHVTMELKVRRRRLAGNMDKFDLVMANLDEGRFKNKRESDRMHL
jgi:hypothetical protein